MMEVSPYHIPQIPTEEEYTFLRTLTINTSEGKVFNSRGMEIGHVHTRGYVVIVFQRSDKTKRVFRRNHVIWWAATGEWPTSEIDHDNRVKTNDGINNLKLSSRMANMANLPQVISKGLPPGVALHKATGRYQAYTSRKHKKTHLGYFATAEEAIEARNKALQSLTKPAGDLSSGN